MLIALRFPLLSLSLSAIPTDPPSQGGSRGDGRLCHVSRRPFCCSPFFCPLHVSHFDRALRQFHPFPTILLLFFSSPTLSLYLSLLPSSPAHHPDRPPTTRRQGLPSSFSFSPSIIHGLPKPRDRIKEVRKEKENVRSLPPPLLPSLPPACTTPKQKPRIFTRVHAVLAFSLTFYFLISTLIPSHFL